MPFPGLIMIVKAMPVRLVIVTCVCTGTWGQLLCFEAQGVVFVLCSSWPRP